jgi:hypothetical protein
MTDNSRRTLSAIAASAIFALILSGCSLIPGLSGGGGGFEGSSVTVQPLYVSGESGGVASEKISVEPSEDGDLRVEFSENEVNGFGDMTRAASWNAVTVATLLTGAPLASTYRFAFDGAIDGPSAGALTTTAVLSLYFGDEIDTKATMTGTINPTGTVGTVGGIPEKIEGVIDSKKIDKVLIPAGQRNSQNSKGELVDVVQLGEDGGVSVVEVATIYDAYRELTGAELPSPNPGSTPKLSEKGYDKLKGGADAALARFDKANAQFAGLNPAIQSAAGTVIAQATTSADRARSLEQQGLQAGAFIEAQNAAAMMEALFHTFDTVQSIVISGFGALDAKLAASATVNDQFTAQLDAFGTYDPKTLTDVEALVTGYGSAFDALSLLSYANGMLQSVNEKVKAGGYTAVDQLLTDLLLPLIFYEFASAQLQYSKDIFDLGRDNEGGPIASKENLAAIGSFMRRGADANWAAFESGVIQPQAERIGVSNDVFRDRLGGVDLAVALSFSATQGQQVVEEYIGEGKPNAAYAAMGYGILNYSRNAALLEKYYNNGVLDENLTVVGVSSDTILTAALDLGRNQVSRAVAVLDGHDTTSLIAVGGYELAGVQREGDVTQKFEAISSYSEAFLVSRALAFVGDYQRAGWER